MLWLTQRELWSSLHANFKIVVQIYDTLIDLFIFLRILTMTDQELNDLARKFVGEEYGGKEDFMGEAENLLSWIAKEYCIISKKKVIGNHRTLTLLSTEHPRPSGRCNAKAKALLLESLFGKEVFENEEE